MQRLCGERPFARHREGVDENQFRDAIEVACSELQLERTAERMSDHRDPLELKGIDGREQTVEDTCGVPSEVRVEERRHDHTTVLREQSRRLSVGAGQQAISMKDQDRFAAAAVQVGKNAFARGITRSYLVHSIVLPARPDEGDFGPSTLPE